jgi:hypothetical protein
MDKGDEINFTNQEEVFRFRATITEEDTRTDADRLSVITCLRPVLDEELTKIGFPIVGKSQVIHEYEAASILNNGSVFIHTENHIHGQLLTGIESKLFYKYNAACREINDEATCAELLDNFCSGIACTAISFGQTNSGKTYSTMKLNNYITNNILKKEKQISISFIEIRGEQVHDMLRTYFDESYKDEVLPVVEDSTGNVIIQGMLAHRIDDTETLQHIMEYCFQKRVSLPTDSNKNSSRSHAIATFYTDTTKTTLRLIDLAGSERYEDSNLHTKELMIQSKQINYSLGCLKECIRISSSKKKTFVPYRRTVLTRLVKDIFVNDHHKVFFIVHISPLRSQLKHTLNTLEYGKYMMEVDDRLVKEKKTLKGPLSWNSHQLMKFIAELDEKFVDLAPYFSNLNGKTMALEWIGHITQRVTAAGYTEGDAHKIYQAYHELKNNFKM